MAEIYLHPSMDMCNHLGDPLVRKAKLYEDYNLVVDHQTGLLIQEYTDKQCSRGFHSGLWDLAKDLSNPFKEDV